MSKKTNIADIENFLNENYNLRYNEISNQFEYIEKNTKDSTWTILNEHTILRKLLHNHYNIKETLLKTILKSDFMKKFNPFLEYFESLPKWDGKIDYISKLANYVQVAEIDRQSFNLQFKKSFIRNVVCALEVHENKQCFVLVHRKQNSGKTTFLRWLCPVELKEYYTEVFDTTKDGEAALAQNFIINLDELATLQKQEINQLKGMISRGSIKIRLPYDSRPSILKRRANFWASTNKSEFLTDETGNVRWVCFNIHSINWNYKQDFNINDIWAQAYTLYKQNEPCELTEPEIKENEKRNNQFLVNTPEMELLPQFYKPAQKNSPNAVFLTPSEIINKISETVKNVKLSDVRMGKALSLYGFERSKEYLNNSRLSIWGYWVCYVEYTEINSLNYNAFQLSVN